MIEIITPVLHGSSVFREMGYDGIVLESWSRWAGYGILHDANMRSLVSTNLFCALDCKISLSLFKHFGLFLNDLTLFVAIYY